jgi:type IV secretory pathway component VirB8
MKESNSTDEIHKSKSNEQITKWNNKEYRSAKKKARLHMIKFIAFIITIVIIYIILNKLIFSTNNNLL